MSSTALMDEERARDNLRRLRAKHPKVTYTLARLMPVEEE